MEVLFVDTSGWIEALYRGAPEHERFRDALYAAPAIVTTNFVADELLTHTLYKFGLEVAVDAGEALELLDVVRISAEDERAAWRIFRDQPKPPRKKGFSFTDCTSFVVMRRLGLRRAIAKDTHFEAAGFEIVPPRR